MIYWLNKVGFNFNRDKRLCSVAQFKQVFEETDLKVSSKQLLILAKINNQVYSRLGLVVAKKNIRHAVGRNRVKRRIRESFRLNQSELQCLDVVVLARRGFNELKNSEMDLLLARLWLKLNQRLEAWKGL